MMEEFEIPDIHNWEMLLKEKINELQWKTEALDKMTSDLNQSRQMLCDERMLLDKERRRINILELQLKSSQEIIEFLKKDKMKYQQDKVQLQVNCDTASKERDSLLNQTRNAKVDNINLESKIHQLEEEILKKEAFGKTIGLKLEKLKGDVTKLAQNLQRNVSKLEQEQDYLRQTVNVTTKLNQRLTAMGMYAHMEHQKQIETIKELQTRLNQVSKTEFVEKLDKMEGIIDLSKVILDESNKLDDEDLDNEVEAFIKKLRNTDEE